MDRFTSYDLIDIIVDSIDSKLEPIYSVTTEDDFPEAVITLRNGQVFTLRSISIR